MNEASGAPAHVFQIFINDHDDNLEGAAPLLRRNVQSLKDCYPTSRYQLLGDQDILSFLAAHFDQAVLSTYKSLVPYAYKADFARYCLLYVSGGLYADLGLLHINPLRLTGDEQLLFFRDFGFKSDALWAVAQGLLLATPRRPEFKCAIDMIVAHAAERYYGANPLDPTGPLLFGRAVARCNDIRAYAMGEVRALSPEFPQLNVCFLTRQGEFAALRTKKTDADISHLGLAGANHYGDIWHNGEVWGEIDGRLRHGVRTMRKGPGATVTGEAIRIRPGFEACRLFGPYCALDAGRYRATLRLDVTAGRHHLDVCAAIGRRLLAKSAWIEAADALRGSQIEFTLEAPCAEIEFRLFSDASFAAVFLGLEIERLEIERLWSE